MKKKKFILLNCFPRSGSTVFASIANQNPSIHSTPTSACLDVIFGVKNVWNNLPEHQTHDTTITRKNVLKGILNSYYEDVNNPIILEKSRGWVSELEMYEDITGEKAKVIATVRPIYDILASMEKVYRKTKAIKQVPDEAANYFAFQNIYTRCEFWTKGDGGLIGLAYLRLQDAIIRGFRDRILFIKYDDLCINPNEQMKKFYDFIGEPYYQHDYNNLEQIEENDDVWGYIDLHKIRKKLEYKPSDAIEILGKDLVEKYNIKYYYD